ncbi:integrin alpha-2-like [Colossoma macropomum]|uniref:integrin alpha-2-like n=1 Tax=Colossoma macropomum TaxID=42526 RepID=UPI001864FD08|nr:integrin alpha-2-like [Colossoma macropomum]
MKLNTILILLALHYWSVEQIHGFNVGTAGAKVFSGAAEEEFGYTVQQFTNQQGKWLLVGSPWQTSNNNRVGGVYKCEIMSAASTCEKLNLQSSFSTPTMQNININISLGMTLTRKTKNNGFMTCGPLWAQSCGAQNFVPGVCAEVSPLFSAQPAFSPALQNCGGPVDIAIVLDGSNSIYPWRDVRNFLNKFLGSLDIGPNKAQVSLIQYSNDLSFQFYLNTYQSKDEMLEVAATIQQKTGDATYTFAAIDSTREQAFIPEHGGRPDATKVMVVVTDGESADGYKSKEVIERCEKDNIIRFGIAVSLRSHLKSIADIVKFTKEIETIASNPKENYVFNVSNEAGLVNIAGTLGNRIFNIEGTGKGQDFEMEMAQVGFSAHQTKNEDVMMLGAVGAYGWSGTVVHKSTQRAEIFPKEAFQKILEDKNHSSLLGYSVSTLNDGSSEFYVAGAPRSNHTGQVVVYTLNSQRQPNIINSQRGDQIGSYFGSVLCPLDVDRDGVTDILLVGAPMYMSDQKKETGKVYIYSVIKGVLSKQGSLEGSSPLENARFGMAITAVPDLNLDGLTDVVVGAPLEENNQGAIYVYNGDQRTIRKQSSQRILGSKLDPALKFFGRSLDGSEDLNGDSIPDVSVGGYGKVLQLWSKGVAVVMAKVTFTPDRISILSKAFFSGRIVPCFTAKICFSATFRPADNVGPAAIKYNLTLDADLTSSRFSSRGHFSNLERVFQQDISVSTKEICQDHEVYIHEAFDYMKPVALRVDVSLQKQDSTLVLDLYSIREWEFHIPFLKECGSDDKCVSDLQLSVIQQLSSSKSVVNENRRLSFTITVKNRKENAYNTRVSVHYSRNLFYSSVTHNITCESSREFQRLSCQVGHPALKTGQMVTFHVNFSFNLEELQKKAELVFEAQSDSEEETPSDNKITVSIPVKYSSDIILSRDVNPEFCVVDPEDQVKTTVSSFDDIGPEFNYTLRVSGGNFPVTQANLSVFVPTSTGAGNPLIYITSVSTAPAGNVKCNSRDLIDPFRIKEKAYTARFTEDSFRGTKELNEETSQSQTIKCVLKDLRRKSMFVNITARIWNGTFATADFQSVVLAVRVRIETPQPDLLVTNENELQAEVTVSKTGAKADVPVDVVVGSCIGGILLLAALTAVLWKFGFFKRKRPIPEEDKVDNISLIDREKQ